MIKEEEVVINGHSRNIQHYKKCGYSDIEVRKPISVKIEDLTPGSTVKIHAMCDNPKCKNVKQIEYRQYYTQSKKFTTEYYCSGCKWIKTKKTNLAKYGVENIMQSSVGKDSLKKTIQNKYGTDHYFQSEKFKDVYKETMMGKYGVENAFQAEEVKKKIKQTNIEKYGVEYPSQSKEILKKSKKTLIKNYNVEHPLQSKEILEKMYENNFDKYGVNNTFKLDKSISNSKKSTQNKYGVEHYFQSEHYKKTNKTAKELKTRKTYETYLTPNHMIKSYKNNIFKIFHKKCNDIFESNRDLLYQRHKKSVEICTICNPIDSKISDKENKLFEFIKQLNKKIEIKQSDRSILDGKELDIYIPEKNLAIEFNGLYWHSELYKDNDYHLKKTEICNNKGIDLLHIFEDDWLYKREIIKSIIRNKMGLIDTKVYARVCEIREVKADIARVFLDNNHIQGFSNSSYKIGLYFEDELVSLMTFGYRQTNAKKEFELIRFCNRLNINVIGAASKLFNHFLKNYSGEVEEGYILSYADISLFNGGLYETLGFKKKHRSVPNYFWVVDDVREHRFKYNKQKLIAEGFDPLMTEKEIMYSRGYYRIFGSGQDRYEYHF